VLYPKLLRIVGLLAGRAFVGPGLNRNEEWLDAQIRYTIDLFMAAVKVRGYDSISKFFALSFRRIPEVNQVHAWQAIARKYIVPIIKERTKQQAANPSAPKPADMIQWVMEAAPKNEPPLSHNTQAELQMLIGLASIHTTSIASTNCIYDLVYRPEHWGPLREEADRVWKEENGNITKIAMSKLVKLDSFMKESQRCNANNLSKSHAICLHPGPPSSESNLNP
jgi:cytochrome P450